jgi:hypothetical protein
MIDRFQMNKSAIVFAMAGVGSWFWPPSEMFDFLLHVIVWGLVLLFVVWLIGVIIGNL